MTVTPPKASQSFRSLAALLMILAVRNVLRNPKRSLLTVIAVIIGVGGFIGMASIARGVSGNMAEQTIAELTGHAQIHAPKYLDDPVVENSMNMSPTTIANILKKIEGISTFASRVRVPAAVVSERNSRGVTLVGIDPRSEVGLSFIGEAEMPGRKLESANDEGILLGAKLAEELETRIGKRIVIITQSASGKIAERGFRVVGLFRGRLAASEQRFAFIGLIPAQRLLGLTEEISEVSFKVRDESHLPAIILRLDEMLSADIPGLEIAPWTEIQPMASAVLRIQNGFLAIWLLIVVITVAFGVVNTLFMAIFDRIREIGLFQALGMPPKLILVQVVIESTLLLFAGVVGGTLFGFGVAGALSSGIDLSSFAEGVGMAGIGTVVYPMVKGRDVLMANGVALLLGVLSSLYPALFAARLEPLEALHKV